MATSAPIRSKPAPTVWPVRVAVVDALADHRELEAAERDVPVQRSEVASPAPARSASTSSSAGREPGAGPSPSAIGLPPAVDAAEHVPVDQQQPEVGERVAEGGHLPVEHRRRSRPGRGRRAGCPAGSRRARSPASRPRGTVGGRAASRSSSMPGSVAGCGDRSSCSRPAAHLPVQVALGPAEVGQPDRGRVDRVQLGEGVHHRAATARRRWSAPSAVGLRAVRQHHAGHPPIR